MTNFNRARVIEILKENESTPISFYKLDGTLREMNATLNPVILRKELGEADTEAVEHSSAVSVYDLDLHDWRAFVFENLVTIGDYNPE